MLDNSRCTQTWKRVLHGCRAQQSTVLRFCRFVSWSVLDWVNISLTLTFVNPTNRDSVEEEVLGMEAAFVTNVGLVPKQELRVVNADPD